MLFLFHFPLHGLCLPYGICTCNGAKYRLSRERGREINKTIGEYRNEKREKKVNSDYFYLKIVYLFNKKHVGSCLNTQNDVCVVCYSTIYFYASHQLAQLIIIGISIAIYHRFQLCCLFRHV